MTILKQLKEAVESGNNIISYGEVRDKLTSSVAGQIKTAVIYTEKDCYEWNGIDSEIPKEGDEIFEITLREISMGGKVYTFATVLYIEDSNIISI